MSANTFGTHFRLTSFGESHGIALGAVIDGCPAGVLWNHDLLLADLERRRPGQNAVVSQRAEQDNPEVMSGVFENKTLGTPIAVIVRNHDAKSNDYDKIKNQPRAGHADDVWKQKFGHADHRGGGRSSGRETVSRVIGGSVAKMLIHATNPALKIYGFANQIGEFLLTTTERESFFSKVQNADDYSARFPAARHLEVFEALKKAQKEGDSWGGQAEIVVKGVPPGLGQPVFHKLKADLAAAMMSVGATSGFEIGAGTEAISQRGTEFHAQSAQAQADQYGGLRGGITTGEDLILRVSFKPTSSILDVAKRGRHDPCIVPRAIPVLEAMVAMVIADHILWSRLDRA